jgi:hypothetical protein
LRVKDLILELAELDPEALLVMSSDGEGNNFGPLDGVGDKMMYIPESTYSGYTRFSKLTKELKEQGYSREDCFDPKENTNAEPCYVLWPVN